MIQGNNCKLNESLQKSPEKRVAPKLQQKCKALTEKTKFTLQYNIVNSRTVKNSDKKVIKSLTPQQSRVLGSSRANLTGMEDIGVKTSRDEKSASSVRPNNERKISSLQFLTIPSRTSTESNVSTPRRMTKISMKAATDLKKNLLPTKPESKHSIDFHVQTCCPPPWKTEIKTASGKVGTVKKSRYSPFGMMLEKAEKPKKTLNSTWKGESGYKSTERRSEITKQENIRPGATVRDTWENAEEDRKVAKERSRSQEIERITQRSVKQDERKRSEGEIFFNGLKKTASDLGLRERNWETRSVPLDSQEKTVRIDSSSAVRYTASKDCIIVAKQNFNAAYDSAICHAKSSDCKNNSNMIEIPDQNSNNKDIQNYSSCPVEQAYLSLEPEERVRRDEELLSVDKKIWNTLEEQIRETCEKTEILYDSGDDSGESLSDIMHQSFSNRDDEAIMGCLETTVVSAESPNYQNSRAEWNKLPMGSKFRCQYPELEKPSTESRSNDLFERPKSRRAIEETFSKKTTQDSKRTKSSENPQKNAFKQEFRTKSLGGDTSWANLREQTHVKTAKERKTVNFLDNYKFGSKCDSSSFFQTHKNVGFIGKDVDEEYVSFEPDQVTLYQPHESQMLLYDIANCVATQGYLKMCGISYDVVIRKNAEQMSPSGRVPFISSSLCIIPEFEAIVSFLQYKKFACIPVQENDQHAFRAIISMIVDVLEAAERYICWYDDTTLLNYTRPRIKGQYPFPLNHIMHWKKKQEEKSRLTESGYSGRSFDLILGDISSCFRTLSRRLGNNSFFFGNVGTEVDALVYGHVYALFTTEVDGPLRDLQFIIQQYPNLVSFACNFDKNFSLDKFPSLQPSYWDNILTEGRYPSDASFSFNA